MRTPPEQSLPQERFSHPKETGPDDPWPRSIVKVNSCFATARIGLSRMSESDRMQASPEHGYNDAC